MEQFGPNSIGGGLVQKFQYFGASGVFYPTQALLDAGGVVDLDIRGGGGGGGYDGITDFIGTGGGNSRHVTKYQVTSLAGISVTVGTGGAGTLNGSGTQGGTSAFGTVSVPGGFGGGNVATSGKGTGNLGVAGRTSFFGVNNAYNGKRVVRQAPDTTWVGSGIGGAEGSAGLDGSVLVSWWEKAQ